MRHRVKDQLTAADVVNYMSVDGLRQVIKKYGEERHAKIIAHAIVDSRYAFGPITTTTQLANIVTTACSGLEHNSVFGSVLLDSEYVHYFDTLNQLGFHTLDSAFWLGHSQTSSRDSIEREQRW